MFSVSREVYEKSSDVLNHSSAHGRYTRLSDNEGPNRAPTECLPYFHHIPLNCAVHADRPRHFVAPELSRVERVEIVGFPAANDVVQPGTTVDFRIVKNGARGNVAVQVIPPSAQRNAAARSVDLIEVTADAYAVHVPIVQTGTHLVHIRFNDVELPGSPLTLHSGSRD